MMESTAAIAPPPKNLDLNPENFSGSEKISIPPLDPLFLSSSDPISMETTPIPDLDFLLDDDNGDFADLDYDFDNLDNFFDFTFDAVPDDLGGGAGEEIGNHPSFDSSGITRNGGDRVSEEPSDSVHSQVSSQGSKTFVSGVCDTTVDALSSPDSIHNHQEKSPVSKRKKEKGGDSGGEFRSCKYRKSDDKSAAATAVTNEDDDDEKKKLRLIRNRESAQLSRLRKKQYVEELQGKVKSMSSTIAELNSKISYVMAENVALRQQMAAAAGGAPPPMNPYMAAPPLPYQWMPYPPYPIRGYGSQTPLVPIPKLNPNPVSGCRLKNKKDDGKSKVKKVASISFIGILFFIFMFGTLVPFMNVHYGENGGSFGGLSSYGGGHRYYNEHKGKVLMVGDGSNVRRERVLSESRRDSCGGVDYNNAHPKVEGRQSQLSNASEPLFASLYVPRNDGLVKIDGNLIIHSVLASEKATAFAKKNVTETLKTEDPELIVPGALSSALAVPEVRGNAARLPQSTALSSGSPDRNRLHQWFHEGGSGTLMDYSMCTEVFQFDIAPGAIVPSSVSNISAENLQNVTNNDKRVKNRRTLEGIPVSLVNITGAQPSKEAQNKSVHGNANKPTSPSSMVVSVLLDPREVVDSETDRVIPPKAKSLSRIFVVVLLDSVKYVTYSCVLPRSGLHLVAT